MVVDDKTGASCRVQDASLSLQIVSLDRLYYIAVFRTNLHDRKRV